MNDTAIENPYRAPARISEPSTARGYTTGQCLRRFLTIGVIGGAAGGAGTSVLNSYAVLTIIQILPVGFAFGVSLWLAIGAFVDRLSAIKTAVLILGSLAGFAATAIVYTQLQPANWYSAQPWTWKLLSPYVLGAAAGSALIVATVRIAGGKVPICVLFMAWIFISLAGFLAFFTVDELGTRTRRIAEPIVAFFCSTGFIAVVLAMIGWQLAIANADGKTEP